MKCREAVVLNCWDVYRCRDLKDIETGRKIAKGVQYFKLSFYKLQINYM